MHDVNNARADAAQARTLTNQPIVPSIRRYELRNVLVLNERRGRIAQYHMEQFLELTGTLPRIRFPQDSKDTLRLARKHRRSFYDAAYLALPNSESIPIATIDRALEAAAKAEGIEIIA